MSVLPAAGRWTPFDGRALLDDVGTALDEVEPAEDEIEGIAERLRGHLMRLVDIAVAAGAGIDEETAALIEQARDVRVEEAPGSHWRAVGHVRRMAWTANNLLERLSLLGCLRQYA